MPLAQTTHEKISKESIILKRPGRVADSWEQWLFMPGRDPELLPRDIPIPQRCERLITLPSSTLFAWPLWVAGDGDALSLVRMELSGRHLLKRGMEESLVILPILQQEDRQLLLAVAPEEPFPGDVMPPQWKSASRMGWTPDGVLQKSTAGLVLWCTPSGTCRAHSSYLSPPSRRECSGTASNPHPS